jgi:N utilization substance protein B
VTRRAPRAASRQLALQVLYALDLAISRKPAAPPDAEEVFADVARHFDLPEGARAFAEQLVHGVSSRREALDAQLGRCARNWRVDRMAAVDRNVLRLAAYELACGETPASVVIDQAIELARRFGDEPSPAFVNGVLDAVARELGRAEPSEEVL